MSCETRERAEREGSSWQCPSFFVSTLCHPLMCPCLFKSSFLVYHIAPPFGSGRLALCRSVFHAFSCSTFRSIVISTGVCFLIAQSTRCGPLLQQLECQSSCCIDDSSRLFEVRSVQHLFGRPANQLLSHPALTSFALDFFSRSSMRTVTCDSASF